ncbi:hypothetical protein MASR1M36_14070 [Candidatus Cloacimonadaceae bacterium]
MKRVMVFLFVMIMFSCLSSQNYTFTDIGAELIGISGAFAWGDYDNDGDLDIVITGLSGSGRLSRIYRNDGNETFSEIQIGLPGVTASSISWGDYDNDGDLDILLNGYTGPYGSFISKIYRNNGNNSFTDINAGLQGVNAGSAAWGDYDNDSYIDILLGSIIYHNNGDGSFTFINSGLIGGSGISAWGDYDNDGDLDILRTASYYDTDYRYVTKLYRNDGNNVFTDINAGLTGVATKSASWGDYDNDGNIDILLTGYTGYYQINPITKIYHNNGNGSFTDINAGLVGIGSGGANWGDYDNDGDLDILLSGFSGSVSTMVVYRNDGQNSFTSISLAFPSVGSNSATWSDIDNDGDLDITMLGNDGDNNVTKIYRNLGGNNNWLGIRTKGVVSNTNGIGTRIRCGNGNSQYREISSCSGWVNGVAHFGLGNQNIVDQLTINWATSGLSNIINQVQANQYLSIFEGSLPLISLQPNGGETLPGAMGQSNTYPITWEIENPPQDLNHITLYYSIDSGITYPNLIADNEANDGSYTWAVPGITSSTVRIKMQVKNSSGIVIAERSSSSDFAIDTDSPAGSISLASPVNGAWTSSTPYFDWSTSGLTDVTNMAIIVDGAYLVQGLSTTTANSFYQTPLSLALSDGWHTWTVRGLDAAGNWVQATQSWSIRVDATPPSEFSLNTPTDNLWLATQSPTFVWNASMDNGSGMSKYQVFVNNTLKKDNIAPATTQWIATAGFLNENAETGIANWSTSGTWGLTTNNPHSGSYCITDSPSGNYSGNQNYSITLAQPILLNSATTMSLTYWWRCNLESGWDYVYVEISNNGTTWTQIANYSSTVSSWTQATHNLNIYASWTQIYIRYRITTDSNGNNDGFYFDDFALTSNGAGLADGNYTWCINAVDNVGNIQQSTDTRTLHIDTTAPYGSPNAFANLTPANNSWAADTLNTFSWTPCTDDGIGLNHYELWIDGTMYKDSLNVTQYQLRPSQVLANGSHNWYVKAYDSLGNNARTATYTLKIDRIPPSDFTLSTPFNGSYFVMPTPTFTWNPTTDSGSGIAHYELWIDGVLNIDNLSQTSSSPANALTEGTHLWYIVAVDNVGNRKESAAIWTTIGDWNPPTQPVLTSPINNQIVSISRPILTWQKSTDAGTGVHHYSLYMDNVLAVASYIPSDINAQVVSVQSPNSLANGNHTWYVKAFDNAGGESSSAYGSFMVDVDITPPSSSITNPIASQYIGGASYLIFGTASDNTGGSGVQKVEISFDGGNNWLLTTQIGRSETRGETQFASNQTPQLQRVGNGDQLSASSRINRQNSTRDVYNWQYNWTGYQTGSVTIKTRATDMNNNVETPPYSLPVFVEKIAPVIQSLNTNPSYAKAGTVTFTMVFQTGAHCNGMNNSVTPTVTITPAGGTARAVTQTSYQGNTWTGQTTIAQSDLNGTAVISVSNAKDNINNQMLPNATHTFVIDTMAPAAFSLISPATGAWLNVNQPQLTWGAATDITSGIDHYALEIDGSINSPGISSISPTLNTIQPAAALTMGTHNWRIKAYDRAGNSTWSSDTFSFGLDLTPPVSAIAAPTHNSTIGGLAYTISGTSTDGTGSSSSGVGSVQIRINNGSWLNTVNTGTGFNTWTYAWTGYTSGTYTLQSRAIDSAGNIETSPLTTSVTVNLNPPTVQSIIVTPNPAKVGTVTCNALFTVNSSGINNSVHPNIWFTTPNGTIANFTETSFSGNLWVGTAAITGTTQNGTATVRVTGITDNYNNTMAPNNNAGTFVIDTVAPVVSSITVTPQITNVRTDLGVQVNFTEITAGLNPNISPTVTIIPLGASASGYITVTQTGYNATTRVWSGVATITATTPEGLAAIKVASAVDMAGNVMQVATLQNQFTIDRSAPTAFNILQPVEGSWTANRQPIISWSPSSDTVSGLSAYQLIINGEQVGNNILPTATTATIQTSLPDADYSIRVKALDNAQVPNERLSGAAPTLFHVDGSAPISLISSPENGFVVNGNSVVISGTATDGIGDYAGIGVKYVKLSKNGGGVWDTVYTAASQVQGSVNWNWNYTNMTPGNYTISVKAIDWLDNEELTTSSISITVVATTPTADFTATPTTGVAPLSVEFLDTSSPGSWPIASWSWNFGDGSAVSNLQNPTHVYTSRGVFTVSLTVSDAYNTSNTITISDMINVTNQAPEVMLPLPDVERNEDFTTIVIDLSNHFQDGDGDGDVLSYSVAVDPTLVNVTITDNSLTINSITNIFGSVNVSVTANDQYPPLALVRNGTSKNRATCTDSFVLLINPVNDAPMINLPASLTFAEDGSLVVDMAPYVSDVDSPNLTITAQNGAHVSVEMNGLNATLTAAANWNGTETVGFTVSDGALTATGETNVIVLPVNDPPALDLPASFTFAEDENLTIDLALYASDIDNSNLTLTVSGNVNVTVGIVGLEVTLGALLNWSGTEQLVFTVSDNMSRALASDSINIIVSPVNDAPIISSFSPEDTTLTLQLNDTQSFSVIAVDVDNDISYSWFINDVNQSVSLNTFEYQFTQSSTHVVKVVVTDGIASVEQTWTVSVPVANDDPSVTPFVTKLYPNYPNPFNPETTIQYSLEAPGWVDISIYNIGGQLIRELKRGNENSGRHSLIWNGLDNDDNAVATGLYYVRMRTNNSTSIIKMTLMK